MTISYHGYAAGSQVTLKANQGDDYSWTHAKPGDPLTVQRGDTKHLFVSAQPGTESARSWSCGGFYVDPDHVEPIAQAEPVWLYRLTCDKDYVAQDRRIPVGTKFRVVRVNYDHHAPVGTVVTLHHDDGTGRVEFHVPGQDHPYWLNLENLEYVPDTPALPDFLQEVKVLRRVEGKEIPVGTRFRIKERSIDDVPAGTVVTLSFDDKTEMPEFLVPSQNDQRLWLDLANLEYLAPPVVETEDQRRAREIHEQIQALEAQVSALRGSLDQRG